MTLDSEKIESSKNEETSQLYSLVHQAVMNTLYATPQNEVSSLLEVTEALNSLQLWSTNENILKVLDYKSLSSKIENTRLQLYEDKLNQADQWIQRIEGYEGHLSQYQKTIQTTLGTFSDTKSAIGEFIEQSLLKQQNLAISDAQKQKIEKLVQEYELSTTESTLLLSPNSLINDALFKALDKTLLIKHKAMEELDYPNSQLSKDLVEMCEMHLEAVYDRLFAWVKTQASVFSNVSVQPHLNETLIHVLKKFQSRPAQLSTLADELAIQRRYALQKAFEDAIYHGEHSIRKSIFDPLGCISRIFNWFQTLVVGEQALWTSILPTNLIADVMEESFKILGAPLKQSVETTLEGIENNPILPFKACQLIAMYASDISKLFRSDSSIVPLLISIYEVTKSRFKNIFEEIVRGLLEEKEIPGLDLLPTISILTISSYFKEISNLVNQTAVLPEIDLAPILANSIDPCLQYCILSVQSLSHTDASIFLLHCFTEIKNSISLLSNQKAAAIEKQIQIYLDCLVTELVTNLEEQSGLFPLFSEVEESASNTSLHDSGWTLHDLQSLFARFDNFLLTKPSMKSLDKLQSKEHLSFIREKTTKLFMEKYQLVYEAIKNPINKDAYSELALKSPDVLESLLS